MIDPESFETTSDNIKKMPDKPDASNAVASGFLSHLIELRDRLLRVVIVVAVAFIGLFPFAKEIYNWLAKPLVDQGATMIIVGPVAPFLVPMKLTLLVAFLITLPYLFYQLWSFVAPGLYKHEKRLIYPLLASSIFLFYLGVVFVYYILLPMMFQIIPQFAPDVANYSPDIAQYLDFVMMMFIAFGFGFEMPIATILVISTGMTTAENLKQKRPYVIVGAFVVGMLLTPPDVVSQIMLAVPMWILFEVGLIFSKFFAVRIKEAGEAKEARDSEDGNNNAVSPVISADKLWEDDNYTYEEDDGLSDEERSILNKDPLESDYDDDEYTPNETVSDEDKFFAAEEAAEDYEEPTDEEMEAELDRIEEEEKAEKRLEKKAKKRKKAQKKAQKKKKDSGNKT